MDCNITHYRIAASEKECALSSESSIITITVQTCHELGDVFSLFEIHDSVSFFSFVQLIPRRKHELLRNLYERKLELVYNEIAAPLEYIYVSGRHELVVLVKFSLAELIICDSLLYPHELVNESVPVLFQAHSSSNTKLPSRNHHGTQS